MPSYVDLDADLAAPAGEGGRHPLPSTEDFEAAMRRVGVRNDRPVVVYDDWSALAAGRAWWLLRYHGHPDVRVLDGAWSAWVAAGGAVQTGAELPGRGDFTARPGQMPMVEADEVLGVPVLVDARAPERFRGETEPVDPVAGHIPGAVNVPTSTNLRVDGRFRSAEELRALYAAAGVTGAEAGRGVLRLRRHRRPRHHRAGDRRDPRGALSGQLVGLDHRPGATGPSWAGT